MGMREDILIALEDNDIRENKLDFKILSSSVLYNGILIPYESIREVRIKSCYEFYDKEDHSDGSDPELLGWVKNIVFELDESKTESFWRGFETTVVVVEFGEYERMKWQYKRHLKSVIDWEVEERDYALWFIKTYAHYFGENYSQVIRDLQNEKDKV